MNLSEEERQNIQIAQARRMSLFKQSEDWGLIENIIKAMKRTAYLDRRTSMKKESTRENCLYFTGKEDMAQEILDGIDQVVADGYAIEDARSRQSELEGV